jgi:predicted Rossmann-fold nucleotide-binding protein
MGSSGGDLSREILQKVYRLGEAIAVRDAVLITGGCPGLPYEAVRGAKAKGGLVIGISPGSPSTSTGGSTDRPPTASTC